MESKRINLRFPVDEFRKLSAKAGSEGFSFQTLGYGFFIEWLEGRRSAPVSREFESLTPEEANKLLSVLGFLRNPERVPQEFRSVLETALESINYLMGKGRGEETGQGEGAGQGEDPGPGDESSGEA